MSDAVLTIGPGHTLRAAAQLMAERNVGSAVVHDPEMPGPGIISERDVLRSVAAGENPDDELVATHLTDRLVFAEPDWSLDEASATMARSGVRHLIVMEASDVVGIVSMRDIVSSIVVQPQPGGRFVSSQA
ncbi:MAG: CBS domain-containing protein [Solirubrobacteraceae bacterium]|nr:CBS domain-containing protein [Solirubrobacteraceae bacterium]